MADLIAVMSGGALQQLASPAEIYERPANRFVATFVGNPPMNVLPLKITETGLEAGGPSLDLSAERLAECRRHAVVEIGLRPEDAHIAGIDQPGAMKGTIFVVEPMGNETLVDVCVDGGRLTVRAERGFTAATGDRVGVAFDPANACFFNTAGQTVVHRV
jgi:multiple sugar transport system ATP-binding protein